MLARKSKAPESLNLPAPVRPATNSHTRAQHSTKTPSYPKRFRIIILPFPPRFAQPSHNPSVPAAKILRMTAGLAGRPWAMYKGSTTFAYLGSWELNWVDFCFWLTCG